MWRGGDYVWISYEPWGWTPYHYGRWAFVPIIGWFWVPPAHRQVYWGPGYVGWVRTANHVAWVPLAPREIYYGYGNYGPHSVDLRKRDSRQINVTKITYRNVQVNNSVTVINHNTFVTGRREAVSIKENPFLTQKINIGRPDIKPERASYAPVVKTIQPARLPPQQVSKIQVKELKQGRQLVKEQNRSVINKGQPVKNLAVKTVDQPKSPAEKVQERKQPPMERGKSEKAVESPRAKPEAKVEKPVKAEDKQKQKAPASKPESRVEPGDRKPVEVKEKSAASSKAPVTIEKKTTRQPDEKEKPVAGPAKAPAARGETKGGQPPVTKKETTKDGLAGKGKSDETKEEKIERR